jgi:hypothetical protein
MLIGGRGQNKQKGSRTGENRDNRGGAEGDFFSVPSVASCSIVLFSFALTKALDNASMANYLYKGPLLEQPETPLVHVG